MVSAYKIILLVERVKVGDYEGSVRNQMTNWAPDNAGLQAFREALGTWYCTRPTLVACLVDVNTFLIRAYYNVILHFTHNWTTSCRGVHISGAPDCVTGMTAPHISLISHVDNQVVLKVIIYGLLVYL
jgi:hypothetical protein